MRWLIPLVTLVAACDSPCELDQLDDCPDCGPGEIRRGASAPFESLTSRPPEALASTDGVACMMCDALHRFDANATVTDAIGLSPKRFIERFKSEVGLTPKRYCRILRLQQVIRRAHACPVINWTDLALDCGYFDQAHFVHEFRSLVGMSPTAYAAARTAFQNHVTFLQDDTVSV